MAYYLEMRDDGGATNHVEMGGNEIDGPPSDCRIREECEEWCREGEWGESGANVSVYWTLTDEDEAEVDSGSMSVEIEPNHSALIAAACRHNSTSCGTDPDDHDWTSEGEGGCDQNPGVWSTGGTSMSFASHCRTCGLHRSEHTTGSQRNPGEHDTVEYTMPESWCEECQAEECDCE